MKSFLDFRSGKGFNRVRTFLILALFAICFAVSSILIYQPVSSPYSSGGSLQDDEELERPQDSKGGIAELGQMKFRTLIESDVKESIIFVGDGGTPDAAALELLHSEAVLLPDATRVVFLGDNIYPRGVVSESDPTYSSTLDILNRQIAAAGQEYIFIPGNHDWDFSGPDGWNAIRRQSHFLNSRAGRTVEFPSNGCPGPETAFVNSSLKIVAADTEWWLRNFPKPQSASDGCSTWDRAGVTTKLSQLIVPDSENQIIIFASHHPLESDGHHGRGFNCFQDAGCPDYASMKDEILNAWKGKAPLVCVAGHDHLLQVITNRPGCGYYLTSGTISRPTAVQPQPGSLYASAELGLIRIDLLADGSVNLKVLTVARATKDGNPEFMLKLDRNKVSAN